jgi:DNA-directed RNA polymerase beta subunit
MGLDYSGEFEFPSFIEAQKKSFLEFYENGFKRVFAEINPLKIYGENVDS